MILTDDETHIVKKASLVYRAINHKLRLKIIDLITDQELKVSDIYIRLRLEQSVASQHLAILRKALLVTTRRNGKEIFYRANKDRFKSIVTLSEQVIKIN